MSIECKVTFYPGHKIVKANKGDNLLEVARNAGIDINNVCGGDGICGKCKVVVKEGAVSAEATVLLTRGEIQRGYVLACKALINSDIEVEIPPESTFEGAQIVLEGVENKFSYSPVAEVDRSKELEEKKIFIHSALATKLFLKLPLPDLKDNVSDLTRLYREIRKGRNIPIMQTGLANIKNLGSLLRSSNWNVTVTLGKRNETTEIVQIEAGDISKNNFGVAVDIGTTTVVAHLIDLNTQETLGAKGTYNKQITYGDDVITRIVYASEKDGLEKLNAAIVENINSLIASLVTENNIRLNDVAAVLCAGNTTMTHLLLKIDPQYIRKEPYVPTAAFVPVIRASEVGIKINPRGLLACVPSVSSYVGGDITAGVLAAGINKSADLSVLIDMGTNGEIVLGNKDWTVCAACSSGPAFEGSGMKCGMRARSGAIQSIEISKDFDVQYAVIGGGKPHGICGSALIDILAEFLKVGIVERSGKIKRSLNTNRIRVNENNITEFVIVFKEETDTGEDIVISETDIDNLIRAKGAIYSGTSILVRSMDLSFNDVKHFYISGAFGSHLNIEKAIFFGLLPDIPREKFKFIGNSSIAGARMCLLSWENYEEVFEIAQKMTGFELSSVPQYMDEYMSALFLPHTDLTLFPTVAKNLKQ